MRGCYRTCLILVLFTSVATAEIAKEKMPSDASKLVDAFNQEAEAIRRKADAEIKTRRDALVIKLQELQDRYTKNAMLDEAVAIRDQIRQLQDDDAKKAEVFWGNTWWPAEVLQTKNNQYLIRYTGYSDQFNEWVPPNRIRFGQKTSTPLQYNR